MAKASSGQRHLQAIGQLPDDLVLQQTWPRGKRTSLSDDSLGVRDCLHSGMYHLILIFTF